MTFQVTKRLGGYPCAHRQWKDLGHCSFLHGYDRWIELTWEGERDNRGWVIDFGGLKQIKDHFEYMYDHTVLIAPDDPFLGQFQELDEFDVVDLRVVDPSMEGMAFAVAQYVDDWTHEAHRNAELVEVKCWENEKNAAAWQR